MFYSEKCDNQIHIYNELTFINQAIEAYNNVINSNRK